MCEPETEIEKLKQQLKETEQKNKLLLLENKQLTKMLELQSNKVESMKKKLTKSWPGYSC